MGLVQPALAAGADDVELLDAAELALADAALATYLDRQAASPRGVVEETYADLTGWTQAVANGIAASNGQFNNNTGVATSPKFAYKAFTDGKLGPGERLRITTKLVIPAASGSGSAVLGVTNSATPDVTSGGWPTNALMWGFNAATNRPRRVGGAANSGTDESADLSSTARGAGTHYLVISIDEHCITAGIVDGTASPAPAAFRQYARTAAAGSAIGLAANSIFDGDIHGVCVLLNDSRGAAGIKIGPTVVRRGLAAPQTASLGGTATLVGPSIEHSVASITAALDDEFTMSLPIGWDGVSKLPTIIHFHGSGNDERNPYIGTSAQLTADHGALTRALRDAGFAVLCPHLGGDNHWSGPYAIDAVLKHLRHQRTRWPIGDIGLLAFSMGLLAALNILGRRTIGNVKALVGLYGVTSLSDVYADASYTAAINTAFNIPAGGTYAQQTAGYDPMLMTAADFRDTPQLLISSPGDVTIPEVDHTLAFMAAFPELDITHQAATGAHGDPSHFDKATIAAFFTAAFT